MGTSQDKQAWDDYWKQSSHEGKWLYDKIAEFYRRYLIRPAVNKFITNNFGQNARVLHAGCGSGAVDVDVYRYLKITALDISTSGLASYRAIHPEGAILLQGSITEIPVADESYDGVFNLGVMEHFSMSQLRIILKEFHRILKPEAKIVLFWPPEYGLSVMVLKVVHWIIKNVFKSDLELHPPEISRIRSRKETTDWINEAGFEMTDYYFGFKDMFTHRIVVAKKV